MRLKVSRAHRWLGLLATLPLLAWILSSFVLHGVGLALPNGLQGVYELAPYRSQDVRLERTDILRPTDILSRVAAEGLDRVYWLRLQAMGGEPVYVVKPGPFEAERVYDARAGTRLDPLPDSLLRVLGDEELADTRVAGMEAHSEFNRYYLQDRVPGVLLKMEGRQPSHLLLSTASGRTLRRTDIPASWFNRAYRAVHVFQWGDSLLLFTAFLYGLAGLTLLLVLLGYVLWYDRRGARKRWSRQVRPARRLHARLAPWAGLVLATQMLVGAYLWFNLGPIEARFRGQGSFAVEWSGGIPVTDSLPDATVLARAAGPEVTEGDRPVQSYEWRKAGSRHIWVVSPRKDRPGILFDAATGERLDRLPVEIAREAAETVVRGRAVSFSGEQDEYWMELNMRVPTYLFRFDDPDATDVHVSQLTGEIVQRRPAIWRAFSPFLLYHTFGFTGNPWFDTLFLSSLQISILLMVVSGWRLAGVIPGKRRR
ncbi:MAG: hypothetical protein ACE5GJ_01015 [Gemmatimonadota bacterium]